MSHCGCAAKRDPSINEKNGVREGGIEWVRQGDSEERPRVTSKHRLCGYLLRRRDNHYYY
jgi:hypothetical protein